MRFAPLGNRWQLRRRHQGLQWVESGHQPNGAGAMATEARCGWMSDKDVHTQVCNVSATDWAVTMDGPVAVDGCGTMVRPDAVDVQLSPEAAEERTARVTAEAVMPRREGRLHRMPHRA